MYTLLDRHRRRREEEEAESGFTLIELLIVIVILGILAAIVVFAVQNLTSQSASAACASDFKTVEGAVEVFKAQSGAYPGGTLDPTTGAATGQYPNFASEQTPGPSGAQAGISILMGQWVGTGGGTNDIYGPWLKDQPKNPDHYQIAVTTDGKGTVEVEDGAGNIKGTSAADCSSIS